LVGARRWRLSRRLPARPSFLSLASNRICLTAIPASPSYSITAADLAWSWRVRWGQVGGGLGDGGGGGRAGWGAGWGGAEVVAFPASPRAAFLAFRSCLAAIPASPSRGITAADLARSRRVWWGRAGGGYPGGGSRGAGGWRVRASGEGSAELAGEGCRKRKGTIGGGRAWHRASRGRKTRGGEAAAGITGGGVVRLWTPSVHP
jgi:hypothetical protein